MTMDDLAGYRPSSGRRSRGSYRGHEISAMPPPSSGGVHLIEIFNMLEGFPTRRARRRIRRRHPASMAEAMKIAYADRAEYLGDPDFVKVPVHRA